MPSPHSEKIVKIRVDWFRGRVQTQVETTHSMLHPISTERRRRTCYKHVQDPTCSTQRQQIRDAQLTQYQDVKLARQTKQSLNERTIPSSACF